MPNWVSNSLTVEGNPESVFKLKNQLNTPFVRMHDNWNPDTQQMEQKEYKYDNPIFAFWNVIAPTDIEAYNKQPDYTSDKPYAGNDWYSWNNRNWGTKWDVAVSNESKYSDTVLDIDEANGENHVLVYRYDTAWSPAFPVLEKLSAQYPDLLLTLNYKEETGWGGECEFLRGEMISESDYNWQCYECDYRELGEPPYCEECEYDVCPSCGYQEADEPCEKHKGE
jgi:hypothetical protein